MSIFNLDICIQWKKIANVMDLYEVLGLKSDVSLKGVYYQLIVRFIRLQTEIFDLHTNEMRCVFIRIVSEVASTLSFLRWGRLMT